MDAERPPDERRPPPPEEHRAPPRDEPGTPPRHGPPFDPAALFVLLDGMRAAAPRELRDQVTNLIREFLLTLRSLIDWYLERLDQGPREPKVEDIPIE
jgi:hypothetical protein